MIIIGPINPATIPPNLKSFCVILPVLKAIAFGGVEIGKNKDVEALKPMTKGSTIWLVAANIIAIGIKIVTVAVLLIKLDIITVKSENKTTNT